MAEFTHETDMCAICLDAIATNNSCTTECGHRFCLKCILISTKKNATCPCCRSELTEPVVNDDDYVDNFTAMFHDMDDNNDVHATVDDIAQRLTTEGISMIDLLSYCLNRYNSPTLPGLGNPRREHLTLEYIDNIIDTIEEIVHRADTEQCEHDEMAKEDKIRL